MARAHTQRKTIFHVQAIAAASEECAASSKGNVCDMAEADIMTVARAQARAFADALVGANSCGCKADVEGINAALSGPLASACADAFTKSCAGKLLLACYLSPSLPERARVSNSCVISNKTYVLLPANQGKSIAKCLQIIWIVLRSVTEIVLTWIVLMECEGSGK
jgi:hypothetical protein